MTPSNNPLSFSATVWEFKPFIFGCLFVLFTLVFNILFHNPICALINAFCLGSCMQTTYFAIRQWRAHVKSIKSYLPPEEMVRLQADAFQRQVEMKVATQQAFHSLMNPEVKEDSK